MKLSVVIPTLNEETDLPHALASLPGSAETIVSDGGSTDQTTATAHQHGAIVVSGNCGRARQMNRGASAASGDVLLFLHADCKLAPTAEQAVREALSSDDVVAGSFRLHVPEAGAALRLVVETANVRARYFKAPYGDQALFVRRAVFEELGGFPEIAFMEDIALVRKLRKRGRLRVADATVTTGTRHWERLGPLGTTLLNWAVATLFAFGVDPAKLEPHYRRLRCPGDKPSTENAYSP